MFELEDTLVVRESDSGKAILVDSPILDDRVWVPKSAVTDDSEVWKERQDRGTLVVEDWFADKQGWSQ